MAHIQRPHVSGQYAFPHQQRTRARRLMYSQFGVACRWMAELHGEHELPVHECLIPDARIGSVPAFLARLKISLGGRMVERNVFLGLLVHEVHEGERVWAFGAVWRFRVLPYPEHGPE